MPKKPRHSPRPTGRQLRLNEIAVVRQNPRTGATERLTVSEAIVERLRAGAFRIEACKSIGVSKTCMDDWLYRGARARQARERGERLSADERALANFSEACDRAEADAMLIDWTRTGQLAEGGIPQVTVTERVGENGALIDRTTRTDHTLPNAQVLMWRLSHRWRHYFADRLEVTGAEGGPLEVDVDDTRRRALALAEAARAFRAGLEAGIISAPDAIEASSAPALPAAGGNGSGAFDGS